MNGTSLDDQIRGIITRSRRLLWAALAALGLIAAVAVAGDVYLLHQAAAARTQLKAALCSFNRDLAGAPVVPVPPAKVPPKLAVLVIADSRVAYLGLGCPGRLAPNPSLDRWAAYYRIPLKP